MPSLSDPNAVVKSGPGRLPAGVVPASALLFIPSAGAEADTSGTEGQFFVRGESVFAATPVMGDVVPSTVSPTPGKLTVTSVQDDTIQFAALTTPTLYQILVQGTSSFAPFTINGDGSVGALGGGFVTLVITSLQAGTYKFSALAAPTEGQFLVQGSPYIAGYTISGDVVPSTVSPTPGKLTVTGLLGKALPSLAAGTLQYTGTAWVIASATATNLDLSGQATGDLAYFNGTAWVVLPTGTPGQYLQTQGASAPVWAAGSAGTSITGTGLWWSVGGGLLSAAQNFSGDLFLGSESAGLIPTTVVGLRGHALPVPSGTNTSLQWSAGALSWGIGPGDWAALSAVLNWGEEYDWAASLGLGPNGPISGPFALAYDPDSFATKGGLATGGSAAKWHIAAYYEEVGSFAVYYTSGMDSELTLLAPLQAFSAPPSTMAVDASPALWVGMYNASGAQAYFSELNSGAWTPGGTTGTLLGITDLKFAVVSGTVVAAVGNSGIGAQFFVPSIPTWTQNYNPEISAPTWILKSNGVLAVAIPLGLLKGGTLYTTTNGTSPWTNQTMSNGIVGSSETAVDLAWSQEKQLWLLVTTTGAGNANFYTSTDVVHWTPTCVMSLSTYCPIVAVAALKGIWVAVCTYTATGDGQILYSYDAINWFETQVYQNSTTASNSPTIVASDTMLAYSSGVLHTNPSGSNNLRFSQVVAFSQSPLT